ncbi:MAG: hypothetical protein U0237_17420 [Thermoleophilia bacterium]
MSKNRLAALAVAGIATLSGVSGIALGAGGGATAPKATKAKADPLASCKLTGEQLLTTETSPALKAKRARLDAAVAAGRITQKVADARFTRFQRQLSVTTIVREARIRPLLNLLGMTLDELRDAIDAGDTLRSIIDDQGISRARLQAALRAGNVAARRARARACGGAPKPAGTTTAPGGGTTTGGTTTTAPPVTTTTAPATTHTNPS